MEFSWVKLSPHENVSETLVFAVVVVLVMVVVIVVMVLVVATGQQQLLSTEPDTAQPSWLRPCSGFILRSASQQMSYNIHV
jgi:hypothetical protein